MKKVEEDLKDFTVSRAIGKVEVYKEKLNTVLRQIGDLSYVSSTDSVTRFGTDLKLSRKEAKAEIKNLQAEAMKLTTMILSLRTAISKANADIVIEASDGRAFTISEWLYYFNSLENIFTGTLGTAVNQQRFRAEDSVKSVNKSIATMPTAVDVSPAQLEQLIPDAFLDIMRNAAVIKKEIKSLIHESNAKTNLSPYLI